MNDMKTVLDIFNTGLAIAEKLSSKNLAKEQFSAPPKKQQDQQTQQQYKQLRAHREQQPSKSRFPGSQRQSFLPQRQAPAAGYGPASRLSPPEARQKAEMDGAKIGRERSAPRVTNVINVTNNFIFVGPNSPALGNKGSGAGTRLNLPSAAPGVVKR